MMTLSGTLISMYEGAPPLEDIALGLSRMPRFAGQTVIHPWSVAHHSLVVEALACVERESGDGELMLHALLHDAHECCTADIPSTFKTGDMKLLQRALDARIYARLGAAMPTAVQSTSIKLFDDEALVAEARVVTPPWTYERIVKERGHTASEMAVEIVRDILTNVTDVAETFRDHVERALYVWGNREDA
jgi:histone H3/H4